jgi:hypothetical protein
MTEPRPYKTIKVTPVAHSRLSAIKQGLQAEKQRDVTFSEVLDVLADALLERQADNDRRAREEER